MNDFENRVLVVIGAGLLQIPVIQTAREMGIFVVAVDMNPRAPGIEYASHFIQASTQDPETVLYQLEKFHQETRKVEAILTVGTDASYTVAYCAERLELAGISTETALNATDKFMMRKALRKAKVAVPDFEQIDTYPKAVESFERLGGDCVLKPVKNMGARGVRRINNLEELKEGFEQALHHSASGKVIIEHYIDAPELSIDALVYQGDIFITGVADRIIEYAPYFVETGHIMPSQLPEELINYALDTFKDGVRALGINHGAAKGDIKVSRSACFIGEIAARLSGGFMSTHTYPYSSGVNLMQNMIAIAFGYPPIDLAPKKNEVSIERAIIAPPGIVQSIKGLELAKDVPFVKNIFFDSKVGDKIRFPQNNLDKSGHVIVSAPTFREALAASHLAVRSVEIQTIEDDDQILTDHQINETARLKFNGKCFVCNDCDGKKCKGMLPGVGGIGTGQGFINSVERIRHIDIVPNYINDAKMVQPRTELFGIPLDFPIIPGPITGSITNMGGALTELQLARNIVKGSIQAGSIGVVGDGATPSKYKIGIRVILENFGLALPIFKPRLDNKLIMERIEAAKEAGAFAVGMDIDAASFITMEMKGQNTSTKTLSEIKELVEFSEIPFVLKGILSPRDAENALKVGVSGIIVSNHGGRVNDSLVAPIDMLLPIRKAVGSRALIIFDGGVRNGGDVLKAIALGADLVMIGRPVMIQAVGGGIQGVRQYFKRINSEFMRAMTFAGVSNLQELINNRDLLHFR